MDLDRIRQLVRLARELNLAELELEDGGARLRFVLAEARSAPLAAGRPAPAGDRLEPQAEKGPAPVPVRAPMVGTFYRAPSAGESPFVSEGDRIARGQVLCILEAMKLMNEIQAEVGGRILSVLAEDGQGVDYGQPLFLIEPLSSCP